VQGVNKADGTIGRKLGFSPSLRRASPVFCPNVWQRV